QFETLNGQYKKPTVSQDGITITYGDDPQIAHTANLLVEHLPHLALRVIALERNKDLVAKTRDEAKKKLKDAADVEMADVNAKDTAKTLAELTAAVKRLTTAKGKGKAKATPPKKKSGNRKSAQKVQEAASRAAKKEQGKGPKNSKGSSSNSGGKKRRN
ncbi:hypothetical protein SERLA73DRAFT_157558, partial [Serpula lacrymans var. lacrymans S7.3]